MKSGKILMGFLAVLGFVVIFGMMGSVNTLAKPPGDSRDNNVGKKLWGVRMTPSVPTTVIGSSSSALTADLSGLYSGFLTQMRTRTLILTTVTALMMHGQRLPSTKNFVSMSWLGFWAK